jgi:hypothetical protein
MESGERAASQLTPSPDSAPLLPGYESWISGWQSAATINGTRTPYVLSINVTRPPPRCSTVSEKSHEKSSSLVMSRPVWHESFLRVPAVVCRARQAHRPIAAMV